MSQFEEPTQSSAAVPPRGQRRAAIVGGCVAAMGSAMLTGVLLFVNGSLVLAIVEMFTGSEWELLNKQGAGQFILFVAPVAMVVAEWMMIDYVRTRFTSR